MLSRRVRTFNRYLSTNDAFNAFISKPSSVSLGVDGRILSHLTYTLKDNFVNSDNTTCASKLLSNFKSPYSATVASLIDEHGGQFLGKNNMDEFGMGSSNTNSYYGATTNPKYEDQDRIAGGSSGGSAAAVSAGVVDFSLGTDTGGSVRLPASYCGVIGFKPSYGRISRWGVVAYAQSLDTVGILARDMDTVEKVYGILNQHDEKDPTSLPVGIRDTLQRVEEIVESGAGNGLTIGIPQEFLVKELSPQNRDCWLDAVEKLQDMGHTIKKVAIPSIRSLLLAYYTIATAEAASNLSRYDGLRYGFSQEAPEDADVDTVSALIAKNRSMGFGPEVQKRILLGNYTLSSDSGNHYLKATQVRKQLVHEFNRIFKSPNYLTNSLDTDVDGCDLLISPTSVGDTPTIEEFIRNDADNFLNSYANDLLTIPASLAGLPAISIPWGNQSVQIMSQFGNEHMLFGASRYLLN